jgi:hypothetical protein
MNILTINSPRILEPDFSRATHQNGKEINSACLVTVCAWCYPKPEQQKLMAWGMTLSHGICPDCRNTFLAGNSQTTIKL